jgi:hypothetical protein
MNRGTLLGVSVLVSLIAHGVLFAAAPNIRIFRLAAVPPPAFQAYRVNLLVREEVFETPRQPGEASSLTSMPGTIRDMLSRDRDLMKPDDPGSPLLTQVPRLSERIAMDDIVREHDLDILPDMRQVMDTRIVEISRQAMREDIQVARRLVRPGTTRVLDEGLLPTLRAPGDAMRAPIELVDPLAYGTGDRGGEPGGAEELPPRELEALSLPEPVPALPDLPEVADISRQPLQAKVEQDTRQFEALDDLVTISLETFEPEGEPEGYFRLRISPKEGGAVEILPKDISFVIDSSNSILQRKLVDKARGVARLIDGLRPEDRFNITIFRDTPTQFAPEFVPANAENRERAKSFLGGIESRGQTNVYEGIRPVVLQQGREGVPSIVALMTDGRPTAGIRDGREIINALTAENAQRNSIFTYAAGGGVNPYLLDLLVYRNKGESFISSNIDSISSELPGFFNQLQDPILVECRADFGRINDETLFPRELPDFYRGQAVTVYGRYVPGKDKEFAMRLTGQALAERKEVIFQQDLEKAPEGGADIARNWAFRKVYYLIGEICRVGETPELMRQLRELTDRHNIKTSYS